MSTTAMQNFDGYPKQGIVQLVAESGGAESFAFDLQRGDNIVGAQEGCAILIQDDTVSRQHCLVSVGDTVRLLDLNSTNGTFVNSVPVKDTHIRPGDVIHLGQVALRVVFHAEEAAPPKPTFTTARKTRAIHWQDIEPKKDAGRSGPTSLVAKFTQMVKLP